MALTWRPTKRGGRLMLPGGHALTVRTRGARFSRGALSIAGYGRDLRLVVEHDLVAACVWIPHLAPTRRHVIADRVFRSPAVILATPEIALALVVDIDAVAPTNAPTWLDYDHPRRALTLGAGGYRSDDHVLFLRDGQLHGSPYGCAAAISLRLFVLASDRPRDRHNPYGMVARWLWRRWGGPRYRAGGSQRAPLDRYEGYAVRWAFSRAGWAETVWQPVRLGARVAGGPAFIADVAQHPSIPPSQRRWREQRSIWNQAWFSTQRCANGILRYARRLGSRDLERRARAMTEIALAAPQIDGLFPSVLSCGAQPMYTRQIDTPGWSVARWTNSDRRPASVSADACHLADAATTGRALLEWVALTGEPRALGYAQRLGERLVRLQSPSGAFPAWIEPSGRTAPELRESCESAACVSFLFELAEALPGAARDLLAAAMRGVVFLERLVRAADWQDFETWYSCCPIGRPGRRVRRNGVKKQSTLAMFWTAEALLRAFRHGRKSRHLALCRQVTDELSLYQAVWDPPFLPAPAHGGFGVMNADSEWNDARQSLFALHYLDLYAATGDGQLFERGVSALRAAFSLMYCPENEAARAAYERRFPFFGPESYGFSMENQGHGRLPDDGGEAIGPFCIFTWGPGSALAAAATARDRFGQVYVDSARRSAFGIDGCQALATRRGVEVTDSFDRERLSAVYSDGRRCGAKLRGGRALTPW